MASVIGLYLKERRVILFPTIEKQIRRGEGVSLVLSQERLIISFQRQIIGIILFSPLTSLNNGYMGKQPMDSKK